MFDFCICSQRKGLSAILRALKRGDALVVWRRHRLRRSVNHLICQITKLQGRQIGFHSISENIDTNFAGGRMIFHVIAAMAEFERTIIRECTIAGIAVAGEGTASRKTAIAHGQAVRRSLQRPLSG